MKNTKSITEISKVCRNEIVKYPSTSNFNLKKFTKSFILRSVRLEGKKDPYSWPNSMLAIGLEYSHKITDSIEDLNGLQNYYKKWYDSGQNMELLDHSMNGYSLIYLYEQTKNENILEMIEEIIKFIDNHKRDKLNSLPYRKQRDNIYIDSLGMLCPFLSRYAYFSGKKEYGELAITQILNFYNYGFDKYSKLPYHAYNLNSNEKQGIIGWGRSVGWILIGLIDSIEYLGENYSRYTELIRIFKLLSSEVVKYQRRNGSYSWQLQTFEGPNDSSSTSMISYAICKGVKLGVLGNEYLDSVDIAINYLLSVNNEGYILECSGECRGIGQYPQIYGWYPWSQGFTLALLCLRRSS